MNKETPEQELREKVLQEVWSQLRGDYACNRVWEAWQVGTMTEEDFMPLEDTERAEEITDSIMQLFTTHYKARETEIRRKVYEGGEKLFVKMLMEHGELESSEDLQTDTALIRIPNRTLRRYFDGELPVDNQREADIANEAVVSYLIALRAKNDGMRRVFGKDMSINAEVWNQLELRGAQDINDSYEESQQALDKEIER